MASQCIRLVEGDGKAEGGGGCHWLSADVASGGIVGVKGLHGWASCWASIWLGTNMASVSLSEMER